MYWAPIIVGSILTAVCVGTLVALACPILRLIAPATVVAALLTGGVILGAQVLASSPEQEAP
jgi:hypothetical protein